MLDQVRQTLRRYQLVQEGDRVLVGVSGGPDSLALLHSLMRLQDEFGYSLHAAHLNHCLRPEAAADAAYVCQLVRDWGLPITVASRDVEAYRSRHRLSLEAAAREVRYSFLEETATAVKATKIAVGHQADDQAETVLLNLLRGSGLTGLKAMVPHRGKLIRPLLFVSRAKVEDYCSEQGIISRVDATNTDQVYRRNKIRHLLIPLLAREFNPKIVNTLSRTAVILQEEEELLAGMAQDAFERLLLSQSKGCLVLDRQEWLALGQALQRRVLRQAATMLGIRINFEQVEEARKTISQGGAQTWPGGIQLCVRETEIMWQVPAAARVVPGEYCYLLQVPGTTLIAETGQVIKAELTVPPPTFQGSEDEAWLDWDKLEKPLLVRNWQPGDRFRPLGMTGKKKLQDFFTDLHLPPARRRLLPLVVSGKEIAWVVGLRLAEDFKLTVATRTALHLQLERGTATN